MLFLLIVIAMEGGAPVWHIDTTDVFQPLSASEVVVRPDGHVYVLNFNESHVRHYDADGQFIGQIGRRGKGPGEFTYPSDIFFLNGKLFVNDKLNATVSILEPDGTYIDRISMPSRDTFLIRVDNGWLTGDWSRFGLPEDQKPGLYRNAAESFEEPTKIMTIDKPGFDGGTWVWSSDGETRGRFNPFDNRPKVLVSADGKTAFVTETENFVIHVYDVTAKKIAHTIRREEPRIPFDYDWANERLQERYDRMENKSVKLETDFPEYFPVIRNVIIDPNGNLVVDRWRGRPDDNHHPITIDPKGKELSLAYPWEVLERIGGVHKGHAILTLMNEETTDEAGLVKIPLNQVAAYAEKNPIVYDGRAGRSISITE